MWRQPHTRQVPRRAVAATHPHSQGATWGKRTIQHRPNTDPTQPVCKVSDKAPLPKTRASQVSQEKHIQPHTSLDIYRSCSLIKLVLVGKVKTTLNSVTKPLGFYASKTREFSLFPSEALKNSPFLNKNFFSIRENT